MNLLQNFYPAAIEYLYRWRRAVPLQTFTTIHSNRKLFILMALTTTFMQCAPELQSLLALSAFIPWWTIQQTRTFNSLRVCRATIRSLSASHNSFKPLNYKLSYRLKLTRYGLIFNIRPMHNFSTNCNFPAGYSTSYNYYHFGSGHDLCQFISWRSCIQWCMTIALTPTTYSYRKWSQLGFCIRSCEDSVISSATGCP